MENNNGITLFNYGAAQVRVVVAEDGEPWFVAKDVATVLGYAKPENAVARHCKHSRTTPKRGGGFLTIIPESDLYRLIMRSDLPDAERFQDWVTEEVLPAIRKTGGYIAGEEKMNEDELVLAAMQVLQRKVENLKAQVEQQKPKVEAFNHLMDTTKLFTFMEASKTLGLKRTFFMDWLRANRWIYTNSNGDYHPFADKMEKGLMEVKAYRNEWNGHTGTIARITAKGLEALRRRLFGRKESEYGKQMSRLR